MDEDLDAARAKVFEYRKRATLQQDLIAARFRAAAERPQQRIEAWRRNGPHTEDDSRIFRGMIRSISKVLADYLDARTAASASDSEFAIDRLNSDNADVETKLESVRASRDRLIWRLNTHIPNLTLIVSDLEHRLDELDAFIEAHTISNVSEPAPNVDEKNAEIDPPAQNPLSALLLQLSDPANRKDLEPTAEQREAGKRALALVQEIQGELDAQRAQMLSAGERRHWRFEQWRSIGRHDADLENLLTSILREIKALTDEWSDWHRHWNTSITNTIKVEAERALLDPASRASAAIQMLDSFLQLKHEQFPQGVSIVTRIEAKSSEFTEFVDENLLKKPHKSSRRIWRR